MPIEVNSLQVTLDTLLLAEVHTEFRKNLLSWSKLDSDYYIVSNLPLVRCELIQSYSTLFISGIARFGLWYERI